MLSGTGFVTENKKENMTDKISIICPGAYTNKVSVIKAIRMLSGWGLKEAKDASEVTNKSLVFDLARHNFNGYLDPEQEIENQYKILRGQGCQVGEPVHKILEELRKLGSDALLQGEDELANEILQLVLAEKLRRKPH